MQELTNLFNLENELSARIEQHYRETGRLDASLIADIERTRQMIRDNESNTIN